MLRWISRIDQLLVLQDDDALDHVLELADVARPVVLQEQLPQLVGDRPRAAGCTSASSGR